MKKLIQKRPVVEIARPTYEIVGKIATKMEVSKRQVVETALWYGFEGLVQEYPQLTRLKKLNKNVIDK